MVRSSMVDSANKEMSTDGLIKQQASTALCTLWTYITMVKGEKYVGNNTTNQNFNKSPCSNKIEKNRKLATQKNQKRCVLELIIAIHLERFDQAVVCDWLLERWVGELLENVVESGSPLARTQTSSRRAIVNHERHSLQQEQA